MKKLPYIFLALSLMFGCSDDNKDSTLVLLNNINEDFTLTQLSFYGYEFSDLNLQYGESHEYTLNEGLSFVNEGETVITVSVNYMCSSETWTAINAIDFNEGSQTTISLTYDMNCGGITNASGYCSDVCIQ